MRIAVGVCVAMIAAGLAGSALVLTERVSVESVDVSVEIVIDYDEVVTLAGASGLPVSDVLARLRDEGVTGVGVAEDSLESLLNTGRAELIAGGGTGEKNIVAVRIPDETRGMRVTRNLRQKWNLVGDGWSAEAPELRAMGSMERLSQVGVGWEADRLAIVREAGLTPVARPIDSPVISKAGIETTFEDLYAAGMESVLFQGKFVLGNRELVPETARQISDRSIKYYAVELNVQEGTERLSSLLGGRVIRTHSIGEAELLRMTRETAVARFGRGVRERTIRCCFVRLLLDRACADPMDFNAEYVGMIRDELSGGGFKPGPATTLPEFNDGHRYDPLIGVGIAGGVGLVLLLLVGPGRLWIALVVACGLFGVAQPWLPGPGREALALLCALAFPLLGITAVRLDKPGGSRLFRPLVALAGGSICAAVGGLLIAGLMSDTLTMMRIDLFRGTKLALGGPVLGAALVYGLGLLDSELTLKERIEKATTGLRTTLGHPMSVGLFVAILVGAGAGLYMMARSGNAAASTQSGAEKAMRELLEGILVFRPRTKEFLIGHPALVLAAFLAVVNRPGMRIILAVAATLGLTSLLNTFCHFHTPLMATVLRSIYGVVIGGILGAIAVGALSLWWRVQAKWGIDESAKP